VQAEGILKYCHNDPIQKLVYNPVTAQLASTTCSDFGLWSPEKKQVAKHKVKDRVLTASWTTDGQYLALGLFNGNITIRDKEGEEKVLIQRSAPVWAIQWNPNRDETGVLACACWDQTLSFYQLSGHQVGKDRRLDYDPCALSYFTQGEYLLMGGSNKKVSLHTKEGVRLVTIGEREDWVWCAAARPKQNYVAVGCNDGTITMYQLVFSTVHGLYQDRYAFRENMTDVIIQHLITEQKVRIKCRDYVKKIAVYKDRLAVQLPDRVIIYELSHDDEYDMHYRVKEKIQHRLDCNLIVVTSKHIILCQEKKLQLYGFKGVKEREWVLDSVIRYIKVVGGPVGREGLLVGLKSGLVLKIFIDNPFPIQLIKHETSIRCLDINCVRSKLALVDENTSVLVHDLKTKEMIFQDTNANSVAWNTEMADMFCFSGNGMLNIKTGTFPKHAQKLQGFVVGFNGSKIFCLHYVSMQTIDVPQSASLYRYIEKKDWEAAFGVACLGVTESDWRLLAMEALIAMSFDIARASFIRIRDGRYIELLNQIENAKKNDQSLTNEHFMGDIYAYQGRFAEAAKVYSKTEQIAKAVEMFSDLRKWDEASAFATKHEGQAAGINVEELIRKQATYSEANDPRAAAEMYLACGETMKAIKLIGENGFLEKLIEVVRTLQKTDTQALEMAASFFRKAQSAQGFQLAKEVYLKMDDFKSIIEIHVELQQWEDALALLQSHPEHKETVFLAYGNWLAVNDRFDEAQKAFDDAGRPDLSSKMLDQLTHNAVIECRFNDAGYYFWLLAQEHLRLLGTCTSVDAMTAKQRKHWVKFHDLSQRAEIYFSYHHVFRYTDEPFTSLVPDALFNICRFLMAAIKSKEAPLGVSKIYTIFCLAKQARALGSFKLARYCLDRLQKLNIPQAWREQIDFAAITIRSLPFEDKEALKPVCYRCGDTNPLIASHCVACGHEFIRSFCSFDVLPLVEFEVDPTVDEDEIDRLIAEPPAGGPGRGGRGDDYNGGYGDGRDESSGDLFSRQLMTGEVLEKGIPVKIDRRVLASLEPREVFTLHWNKGKMGESRAVHSPPVYTTRNINSERVASRSLLVHACCDGLRRNAAATV
jgi:intraflagellar transport protein 122